MHPCTCSAFANFAAYVLTRPCVEVPLPPLTMRFLLPALAPYWKVQCTRYGCTPCTCDRHRRAQRTTESALDGTRSHKFNWSSNLTSSACKVAAVDAASAMPTNKVVQVSEAEASFVKPGRHLSDHMQ